jgi:hypothetical protein
MMQSGLIADTHHAELQGRGSPHYPVVLLLLDAMLLKSARVVSAIFAMSATSRVYLRLRKDRRIAALRR